ncbi:MAG: hypothetical protein OHK0046_47620 [Anaerolineae bacterium]
MRVFKVGTEEIVETADMAHMTVDEVRDFLAHTHPEVRNAVIREHTEGEYTIVEFAAQPGRKG